MTAGTLLWFVLLIVLVALFALTLRRMSTLIARTRDLERFQRSADSIDRRLGAVVDPVVAHLDSIRRRSGDPQALARDLGPALATLGDLAREARELRPPRLLGDLATSMVHQAERAVRAGELVRHGIDGLGDTRAAGELEAQTSLKRGALNLRSARIEISRLTAEGANVRPADLAGHDGGARVRGRLAAWAAFAEGDDDGAGTRIDHRM